MRRLRTICVIIFIASLALGAVSAIKSRARDTVGPAIEVSAGLIEVSVKDDEKALLQGMKATDDVDGDVTDNLYVESISPFDEQMHRTVTYIAFDSHNNVTRAQRELVYTDYTAPRFRFEKPFIFDTDTTGNVLIWTTTQDVLDGAKSGNVFIRTDEEIDISMPGEYKVVLETTNSAGDTASIPVTIEVYDTQMRQGLPEIQLRQNIVYLEQGANWDARQYLEHITVEGSQYIPVNADGTTVAAPAGAAASQTAGAAADTAAAAAQPAAGAAQAAAGAATQTAAGAATQTAAGAAATQTAGTAAETAAAAQTAADSAAAAAQTDETAAAPDLTINFSDIQIQDTVNTAVPGNYEVVYTYEDAETSTGTGTARLYVVVTERGK